MTQTIRRLLQLGSVQRFVDTGMGVKQAVCLHSGASGPPEEELHGQNRYQVSQLPEVSPLELVGYV